MLIVSVAENVFLDMMLHWMSCTVSIVLWKTVCCKLDELIKSYRDLNKVSTGKRRNKFYGGLKEFKDKWKEIFIVKYTDEGRRKRQGTLRGVKETAEDNKFCQNLKERKVCYTIYLSFYLDYLMLFHSHLLWFGVGK